MTRTCVFILKNFLNNLYKLFKFFLIFTSVITGWTTIILFSNTSYKIEIKELISKMYINQKNFIFNVKDLSILLLKDADERFSMNPKDSLDVKKIN